MKLYTFIMYYLEGIYTSQVYAKNHRQAMFAWIQQLDVSQIEGFTSMDKQKIIKSEFVDENPVLLEGLSNVWNFLVETKKGFGHVNYIATHKARK